MPGRVTSIKELEALYEALLRRSVQAARSRPHTLARIRALLQRAVSGTVDVDQWLGLATQLALLLAEMGPGTVFYEYFHESIHPAKQGQAQFFRAECQDLLLRLEELDLWRKNNRRLRLVDHHALPGSPAAAKASADRRKDV